MSFLQIDNSAEVLSDFSFHVWTEADCIAGQLIHEALRSAAVVLFERIRECPARDLAYQKLKETKLWADEALNYGRREHQFPVNAASNVSPAADAFL
jgi:hypothetical protein